MRRFYLEKITWYQRIKPAQVAVWIEKKPLKILTYQKKSSMTGKLILNSLKYFKLKKSFFKSNKLFFQVKNVWIPKKLFIFLQFFLQNRNFSHGKSFFSLSFSLFTIVVARARCFDSWRKFYGSGKWATDDLTFVFKLNRPRASTTSFIATITFDSAHFTAIISVPRCQKLFLFSLCRFKLLSTLISFVIARSWFASFFFRDFNLFSFL